MRPGEPLSAERLQAALHKGRFGRSLRVLELTDSTNDEARADAAAGAPDGHVVVADAQRNGRGSHGRTWTSPPGTDLYVSIVVRTSLPLCALPPLTLAAGLGVADAVERLLPCSDAGSPKVAVKWPNDVWIAGRKCAGILVETSAPAGGGEQPAIIGIGLNVNRIEFASDLRDWATSLRAERASGDPLDRNLAWGTLLEAVETRVDELLAKGSGAISKALDARLALRGERVRCGDIEGVLVGVSPSGGVRIACATGVRELLSGQLRRIHE